ncbi:MAG: PEP-CTERM sorting domain-containing protein, partial [Gammaproteobacteria bacterium]|nr:PEP-CTERM sorting domain-containing protein [Gammaproteobacteria bacterium]
ANSGFVEVVTGEIPEPSSYLLMLFSIVLLSVQKRRNIQA